MCCQGKPDALIRAFLVVINVFFGLVGALMIVCGGILLGGKNLIQDDVKEILEAIPKVNVIVGLTEQTTAATPVMDVGGLLQNAAIAFIVLGGVLFVISFLGCIAGCCAIRAIVIVYLIILCFLFICQLVLACLFFLGTFDASMKSLLETEFNKYYKGSAADDKFSVVFNFVQLEMKCCGINNGGDYSNHTVWKSDKELVTGAKTFKIPVTCCVMNGTFPDVQPVDKKCPETPTATNSYYNTGCWEGMRTWVGKFAIEAVVVVCVGLSVQFYLIMSTSMLLCLKSGKENEDDDEK